MAMVKAIHWKVNGRARYQVDGLRNAPKIKTYLESALAHLPEIVHVSAQSLKKLVHPIAEVIRDGQSGPLPARAVTLGDLLVLKPGMFVSADCRIVRQVHLSIDESMLTGESMPVYKQSALLTTGAIPLADRTNMALMGTLVTGGSGIAVVVATGRDTEIGRLQALLEGVEAPATPIKRP